MARVPLLIFLLSVVVVLPAKPQAADPNPGHSPDVFLDNHRSLKPKRDKAATARTVSGKVVDDTGQPLTGALVTLTNGKTNEKNTMFTKKDGRYNFDDVSFTVDYQLQARYKDLTSDTRNLSQYDHTVNVIRILQIEPAASAASPKAPADSEKK